MAKSKKRQKKKQPSSQGQQATSGTKDQEEQRIRLFDRIPLWGWILIFLVPLIASEYMFYRADRLPSMIIFPLAWIGFWAAMMQRSGWPILKKPEDR